VITGDIHASGVADVKADFEDPASKVVGTEFVGNSISSGANSTLGAVLPLALANNPHVRWADLSRRGWVRCEVTPSAWRADFRYVDDVRVPGSPVTTATSWVIEDRRPVVRV
ncbi:MAG: alkaline phosphatase D family protein, partial [Acetobacteraceae bacterium]|nr:alkaline phosphatase D family protein [Acetobacteraceae bacterium]